jgi:hypothetical protein
MLLFSSREDRTHFVSSFSLAMGGEVWQKCVFWEGNESALACCVWKKKRRCVLCEGDGGHEGVRNGVVVREGSKSFG